MSRCTECGCVYDESYDEKRALHRNGRCVAGRLKREQADLRALLTRALAFIEEQKPFHDAMCAMSMEISDTDCYCGADKRIEKYYAERAALCAEIEKVIK